jgi:uncharacterized protein (DUF983 family)
MSDSSDTSPPPGETPWFSGLTRGFSQRCPACGQSPLFHRYLKVNQTCVRCGLGLGEFRADDAPPYFTILLVGHIIVPLMLILEQLRHPPEWFHALLWLPLTVVLSLLLLPRIKGAVIGVQWANRIRG